jgi:6-phosphogluconolactonase
VNRFQAARMKFSIRFQTISVLALLMLAMNLRAREFFVYFGTYTEGSSQGIYVSRLDADTGKLSAPELAVATPDPAFLALAPNKKFLYAANELSGNKDGMVSAFAIDKTSGQLTLLNQQTSGGFAPCHVSVDSSGKTLLVANYNSGSIKSIPLQADGSLGDGGSLIQHHGHSVNSDRQKSPHAHFFTVDPSNHFALACDLGLDKVMIYRLDGKKSTFTTNDPPFATVPPGAGARHLAFNRSGKFAYVINEMGCSVTSFSWDAEHGQLTALETVSALPSDVSVQPNYTAAEILVHPSGKFVYVTVRGHDSISVFAADKKTGRLTFMQNISAGGKIPRGLGMDPTGRWLIVANQKNSNAVEFAIDTATGKLTPTKTELHIGSPVDVKFVKAN